MKIETTAAQIVEKVHSTRAKKQEEAVLETIKLMAAEACCEKRCKALERVPIEDPIRKGLEEAGYEIKTTIFLSRVYIVAPYK